MSRRVITILVAVVVAVALAVIGLVALGHGRSSGRAARPAPPTTTTGPTSTPAPTAPTTAATAATATTAPSASPEGMYLALGDSIAFGYRPPGEVPTPDYAAPSSFVGYPEILGPELDLTTVNASCPGETITSMISTSAKSNGCENIDGHPGGYRTHDRLHVAYRGSQLTFAVEYLRSHPTVSLVTLGIGLNDVAICRDSTPDHCASAADRQTMIAGIGRGLQRILTRLRTTARYRGRIVAVTYYSRNYSQPDTLRSETTRELDSVMTAVAHRNHMAVADGYGAFRRAAAGSDGSDCAAGLTIRLPGGGCDLHPTRAGQALLAKAVRLALGR